MRAVSDPVAHPPAAVSRRLLLLSALAGLVALGVLVGLLTQTVVIGSRPGGWTFDYYASWLKDAAALRGRLTWEVVLAVLGSSAVLVGLAPRLIERWERTTVLLSLVAGGVLQVALRSLYQHPLAKLVRSWGANSFYTATRQHPLSQFLQDFDSISPKLPPHARSNMPGKVMLYYFLELFTQNITKLGLLVIALSTLAGFFIYLITRQLTGDRRTALFALALYCVIPSKVGFLPILNTVTPLFLLAAFWLLLRAIQSGRSSYAALLGIALYVMLYYEPLPFVLGITFGAFVLRAHWQSPGRVIRIVVLTALAFLAMHGVLKLTLHYDIFQNFLRLLEDARHFNVVTRRRYEIWLWANLVEFFLTAGIITSLLMFVFVLDALWSKHERWWPTLNQPVLFLTLVFLLNLLVVDLLGVNRGEITRLWLFLTPFPIIAVAHLCREKLGTSAFRLVFALLLVQGFLHVTTVGFINP